MGDKEAIHLAEALLKNKTVHTLNLDFNNIDEEGARAVAKALKKNSVLQTIYFFRNKIQDPNAKALARIRQELNFNKKIARGLKLDPLFSTVMADFDEVRRGAEDLAAPYIMDPKF
jgi:Ran GTPase-activating protein (RanGAP) involved in mRNA processing and transport